MKPGTREWVGKAEEDFLAATDLARRRKRPLLSSVCFHAQQGAEKYLKARIAEAGLPIRKTHDLEMLLDLLIPLEPGWVSLRTALQDLTDYAVDVRYPGHAATKSEARRAVADCKLVRREVRRALRLHT